MSFSPVLDPEDEAHLRETDELTQLDPGKFRIRSRRFQNRSSSSEESSTFSPPPESVASPVTSDSSEYVVLPTHVESPATLEFLGLSEHKAFEVYGRWMALEPEFKELAGFFGFIMDLMDAESSRGNDAYTLEDDWKAALRAIGIVEHVVEAIVDPEYSEMMLMKSAVEWVKDSMEAKWEYLQSGRDASLQRARSLRAASGQNVGPSGSGSSSNRASGFTHAVGSGQIFAGTGSEPGTMTLWKATRKDKARLLLTRSPNDIIDLSPLFSAPPTDFSGTSAMFYFTPELEGAQCYAAYTRRVYNPADACLVRVTVPNSFLEGIGPPVILRMPSEAFRKTVFFSRQGYGNSRIPDEVLRHKFLIGHTTKGANVAFNRMQSWTDVSERNLVRLPGPPPDRLMTQYVFRHSLQEQLQTAIGGRVSFRHPQHPDQEVDILS